jgi:hypothetical protein
MECGIIYVKIIPKSPKAEWIQYCYLFGSLPQVLQLDLMSVIARINEKYQDKMIVPLFDNVHPGCIVNSEDVEVIAKDLYEKYDELMFDLLGEHCIRCVHTIGDVVKPRKDINTHQTFGHGLIKIGRFLDVNNEIGLFKV